MIFRLNYFLFNPQTFCKIFIKFLVKISRNYKLQNRVIFFQCFVSRVIFFRVDIAMQLGKPTINACHGLVNIHIYTYLIHKNFENKIKGMFVLKTLKSALKMNDLSE